MVIIGLLLGGVLKGQELINSAKAKSIAADLKNVQVFLYGYQDKFRALPGDDANADKHINLATVATTGVSVFAAQIATALGAKVIVTSSRDDNLEAVKKLGAVAGVNYRTTPEWAEEVLKLTDGKGVDLLLDVAGGDGINQSIAATKAGGRIAQIGFLTGQTSALNLMPMIFRQTTIRGIAVAPRSSFDRMNEFLNEHKIRPVIDHVYPFDQAREAYEHLARGAFGKVVIKIA